MELKKQACSCGPLRFRFGKNVMAQGDNDFLGFHEDIIARQHTSLLLVKPKVAGFVPCSRKFLNEPRNSCQHARMGYLILFHALCGL